MHTLTLENLKLQTDSMRWVGVHNKYHFNAAVWQKVPWPCFDHWCWIGHMSGVWHCPINEWNINVYHTVQILEWSNPHFLWIGTAPNYFKRQIEAKFQFSSVCPKQNPCHRPITIPDWCRYTQDPVYHILSYLNTTSLWCLSATYSKKYWWQKQLLEKYLYTTSWPFPAFTNSIHHACHIVKYTKNLGIWRLDTNSHVIVS